MKTMKKINILLATLAMLVATVSCNNDEKIQIEEPGIPAGSIRVNISISDLQSTTKAVKTGWANGDIINIWFDKHAYQTPDLTMTYNNGVWAASEISNEIAAQLKANGTLWGFYEASNSATTAWTFDDDGIPGEAACFITPGSNWLDGTKGYLTVDFNNLSYTFDGTTLSAKLDNWNYGTDFQMVITGLDQTKTWIMRSYEVKNWYGKTQSFYGEDYETGYSWYKIGGSDKPIIGMPNADGLAFYGRLTTQATNLREYIFTLYNTTDYIAYTFTKTAQLNSNNCKKLVAVKVPFNKFVVDMGFDSGTKWAACNLGADYITDYGDYYAWGETEPYYSSQSPLTWKTGKGSGYYWTSYDMATAGDNSKFSKYTYDENSYATSGTADGKITLEAADDAATVAYGSPYRMPTYDDIAELVNNCNRTYVENYLESGVNGYLFTSKKTGFTSQKIFFPAAGNYWNKSLNNEGTDMNIWASTVHDDRPDLAWSINGYPSNLVVASNSTKARFFGFSVRPVR